MDDISRVTRIPKRFLEGLEQNDYSCLPGQTFVRGFLRCYAIEVGLDFEECLQQYDRYSKTLISLSPRAEVSASQKSVWIGQNGAVSELPSWAWGAGFFGLIVVFVVVGVLWLLRTPSTETKISSPVVSSQSTQRLSPDEKTIVVEPSILTVVAKEKTHILIRVDQGEPQEIDLKPFEQKIFNIQKEIEIKNVDKSQLSFQYNGKPLEVSGSFIKLFNRNLYKSETSNGQP